MLDRNELATNKTIERTSDVAQTEDELNRDFYGDDSCKNSQDAPFLVSNEGEENIPPVSPGKKLLRAAASPGRFIKAQVRQGSTNSSVFSLVIICLGAGTLTIPYVIFDNGFILGPLLILFGGAISVFTGYMIIVCCDATNATCYEEIALACFSKRAQRFTSFCMICCNEGFIIGYFVLFKSFVPFALALSTGKTLPSWCNDTVQGQATWGVLFGLLVFPLSIPRQLSALRFSSFISVIMSIFIVGVIISEAILDHGTSETLGNGFSEGNAKAQISVTGIFDSLPLIIFGFMYQMNVPAIYNELSVKSVDKGKKVLYYGTAMACTAYIFAGIFGFATFASGTDDTTYKMIFDKQNIFQAPYTLRNDDGSKECLDYFINFYNDTICVTQVPIAIYVSIFGILFVVTMAAPFCVLPTKDSIEEVRGRRFTKVENFVWSFSLVAIPCIISIPITQFGTVSTILGATTNSAIGFLLPISYYLKVTSKASKWRLDKVLSYILFVFICGASVISLTSLGLRISNGNGDKN